MVWPAMHWVEPAIIADQCRRAGGRARGHPSVAPQHARSTWQAADTPRGGVLKAGEGRAHWMAVGGFFAALLFIFAIGFNTVSVFWGGLCPV